MKLTPVVILLLVALPLYAIDIENSETWTRPGGKQVILAGTVRLAATGRWTVESVDPSEDVQVVYIRPPEKAARLFMGKRMRDVERKRKIDYGCHHVQTLIWNCIDYAKTHDNMGPASLEDFTEKRHARVKEAVTRSPWGKVDGEELEGPFVFLLPNVEFKFREGTRQVQRVDRAVLAVELRPYVDDGKHWVSYTDGSCTREDIDRDLVKKYNLEIRPVLSKDDVSEEQLPTELAYRLIAVRKAGRETSFPITLVNTPADQRITATWDPKRCTPGAKGLEDDLQKVRKGTWAAYARASDSPLLTTWLGRDIQGRSRRGGERTSVFGVLGGRAAVRETLQMQVLNSRAGDTPGPTFPISMVEGVTVKSHPYEEMLKGSEGGRLALAEVVPDDHFFLYVQEPAALLPLLDEGADFLSLLGGSATGRRIKYYLKSRYLARLGLNEGWFQTLLGSGAVSEMALVTPDLFFIDGTDITAVSRVRNVTRITTLLQAVGIGKLSGAISEQQTAGGSVYWTLLDDLLVVGTSKAEVEKVSALHAGKGKGSLGKSAEFRYMLTQLAPTEKTRVYAFFSDPFIRRLVGPELKIAQLRRMTARAEMEFITGKSLLARLDGAEETPSVADLVKSGVLPQRFADRDYTIGEDGVVQSPTYGTLANMQPLLVTPITQVTQVEADAYKVYVDNYSRFWRQFFDPIAIRLDDTGDGALEMTTFILPLIDNTIYTSLKEFVASAESKTALRVPRFQPEPVLSLSVNLKEEAWARSGEGFTEAFVRATRANPAMLDDLGPTVHLAIHDADPVIALGSGDIFSAFGGNAMRFGGGGGMLFIPVALSVLTRPCTLAVETRDPERTLRCLRQTASVSGHRGREWDDEVRMSFYQLTGKDAWIFTFDVMGAVKLRYGVEVRDGFLVLKNIPWSDSGRITVVKQDSLNGARLEAIPASCVKQLNGLHLAAAEHERIAVIRSTGYLYPLVASGYASPADAAAAHGRLLGCIPAHPAGGDWEWKNYHLGSSMYGTVFRSWQPDPLESVRAGRALMEGIDRISLEMQFEHTGLRTRITWKTRNGATASAP